MPRLQKLSFRPRQARWPRRGVRRRRRRRCRHYRSLRPEQETYFESSSLSVFLFYAEARTCSVSRFRIIHTCIPINRRSSVNLHHKYDACTDCCAAELARLDIPLTAAHSRSLYRSFRLCNVYAGCIDANRTCSASSVNE